LANLAGVSLTWYTWLEQARPINVSAEVIDALARTLRLDDSQWRHVRRLAGLPAPLLHHSNLERSKIQRIIDAFESNPAMAVDRWLDVIAINHAQAATFDPFDLPPGRQNLLWLTFGQEFRSRLSNWEQEARLTAAGFRAEFGKHPDDPRAEILVKELSEASEDFRSFWDSAVVKRFSSRSYNVRHQGGETLSFQINHLKIVDQPGVTVLLSLPANQASEDLLQRLLGEPSDR
jgi:transcriptional regulator with XRE-family HTH domain